MELIAGDCGVIQLAVVADLADQARDLVLLLDGLTQRPVRDVDAEVLVQGPEHMVLKLLGVVFDADVVLFERDIGEFNKEVVVFDNAHILDAVQVLLLQMLLEAAGGRAGLGGHLGIEEIEAALERALEQAAGIVAGAGGHIIGGNVRRGAARRSQSDREAAGQVEQYFRHEKAGVADRALALGPALLDQIVIGLLKQVFKKDQVL